MCQPCSGAERGRGGGVEGSDRGRGSRDLEAQLELGEALKGVDVEVEATRRMLGLVEATEQQLADQGEEELHGGGPEHVSAEAGTEVRGGSHAMSPKKGTPMVVLGQPTPADAVKRSRPPCSDNQTQPLLTGALPEAVWGDHLLPLLMPREAARLGCTCKALRGVVRERFRDVGRILYSELPAALTTFPRARTVDLNDPFCSCDPRLREELVRWLGEGGRGRYLEKVETDDYSGLPNHLVHEALQAGFLPSLRNVDITLLHVEHGAALRAGLFRALQELQIFIYCNGDKELGAHELSDQSQLAALGALRQLPALTDLEVQFLEHEEVNGPLEWPPFIPPSLIALGIDVHEFEGPVFEPLLRALPGMLEASGARLERLEISIPSVFQCVGDGLVHVAQTLRCCSPTLKDFRLGAPFFWIRPTDIVEDYTRETKRLRFLWADVLAGVSACRELQVLVLPRLWVEPLFPPGIAFDRLIHLEMSDHEREHPPAAGVMGLWELMASGGLPALAKLKMRFLGRWGGAEEVRTRVAPALEGVAGTLTHLQLDKYDDGVWLSDEVDVGYEFGAAMGKLRRLKDLALGLIRDGRAYHAMAQGLAASGGDRPLPLLWQITLGREFKTNVDLVASLLLPSVRVFHSYPLDVRAALLTACALRQAGYKHQWALSPHVEARDKVRAISICRIIEYCCLGSPWTRWGHHNQLR
jgi:hypothetical protein